MCVLKHGGRKMFCSKCGKEITDDSKFCCSCGSTVEIKEKQDTINDTRQKEEQDTKEKSSIINNNQTDLNPPLKTKHDIKRGYGCLVLLFFYGYSISLYSKKNPFIGEIYSIIIIFLGLLVIYPIYFWFRNFLIIKNFWNGHIGSSSLLSGIITYILVGSLVGGSIGFIGSYEKRKEINQFTKDSVKQTGTITGAKWVFYGTTNLGDYFYDNNSVNNVSQNIIGVWDKVIYSKAGKDKVIEIRKNNKLPIDGYDKLDNQIFLLEVDCRNNTIMVIKTVSYDEQGKTLYNFEVPRNSSIRHVKPETMEETILKKVCNK